MKRIFYITFFLLLARSLISCSTKHPENENSSNKMILIADLGGIRYLDTNKTVHISTTIINPTLDTIKFMSMSCSYEDFFKVGDNSEYIIQSRYDCFSNAPVSIVLPPNSQTKRFIMISLKNKRQNIHSGELKIGMQYILPNQIESGVSFYENRFEIGKTIWSNKIDLSELYRKIYTIPRSIRS